MLDAVIALASPSTRAERARELAERLGGEDLVGLVADGSAAGGDAGAFVLAPSFTLVYGCIVYRGPQWRALAVRMREKGTHSAQVEHPSGESRAALAVSTGRSAFVLISRSAPSEAQLEPLARLWPLIESALLAEHAQARDARLLELARAEAPTRAKDHFLAMLGHELRNPLAPIVTALHLLRARGETSREILIIERQVQHLLRLVDDLLDVGRVVSGKLELRREIVDVGVIVERAIEMVSPLLERRKQRLELITEPARSVVDGDPARLAQVVSNLLTNASRYSPEGASIRVRVERTGDRVALRVQDEGVGMSPEVIERAFEVFFQAPQSFARTSGGLSLGLAIVRSIVEQHAGQVRAESAGTGRGTTGTVTLPLADPERRERMSSSAIPRARWRGLRVLVVDDNEPTTAMLALALRRSGCEVATALDGPSALEAAERLRPTIALLDLGLPVMDGFELAQRLRERPWASGLRLIAISGYSRAEDRELALAAGFDRHVVKPVAHEELVRLLSELVPADLPEAIPLPPAGTAGRG
jgi:signal transduction histidine kinase/ActR/RegA family two-component response regulator